MIAAQGATRPVLARPVLVGQDPIRPALPGKALVAPPFRRLADLAGVGYPDGYEAAFERLSLLPRRDKTWARGDAVANARARLAAWDLFPGLAGRRCVLLGRGVGDAFAMGRRMLEWRYVARRITRQAVTGALHSRCLDSFPVDGPVPAWARDRDDQDGPESDARAMAIVVPHPGARGAIGGPDLERVARLLHDLVSAAGTSAVTGTLPQSTPGAQR